MDIQSLLSSYKGWDRMYIQDILSTRVSASWCK